MDDGVASLLPYITFYFYISLSAVTKGCCWELCDQTGSRWDGRVKGLSYSS